MPLLLAASKNAGWVADPEYQASSFYLKFRLAKGFAARFPILPSTSTHEEHMLALSTLPQEHNNECCRGRFCEKTAR